MKKYLWLILLIAVLLLLGTGYYLYKHRTMPAATSMQAPKPTSTSMFTSIQDALAKSLTLQCSFTDDMNRKTTAYIKSGAVRVDFVGTNSAQMYNSMSVIMKDQRIYMWDPAKKQGMTMVFAIPTGAMMATGTPTTGTTQPSQNGANVLSSLDKFKDSCKPAVVADTMFTIPTDVTFQDLSKMMQQYQQKSPGY